jgi:hypothetical protein
MTKDPDLRGPAQRFVDALAERVRRGDLAHAVTMPVAFHGVHAAAAVAQAMRSAQSAGLNADPSEAITAAGSALERVTDAEEALVARLYLRRLRGEELTIPPGLVERMLAQVEAHLAAGRPERLYLMTLVCFHAGGEAWRRWNGAVRNRFADLVSGPGTPHPAGPLAGRLMLTLALECYNRYAALKTPAPAPDFDTAGWPVAFDLPAGQRLSAGRTVAVELPALSMNAAIERHGLPALDPAVWRRVVFTAPAPLPAGPCTVVVDGADHGAWRLPFSPPGGRLVVPAGIDHRLRLERTLTVTSDDRFLVGRTAQVAVRIRLHGPPEWKGMVAVAEPLPLSDADELRFQRPALSGRARAQRLDRDPWERAELGVGKEMAVSWELRYGTDQRPSLEVAP